MQERLGTRGRSSWYLGSVGGLKSDFSRELGRGGGLILQIIWKCRLKASWSCFFVFWSVATGWAGAIARACVCFPEVLFLMPGDSLVFVGGGGRCRRRQRQRHSNTGAGPGPGERNLEYSDGQRPGNRLGNECSEQRSRLAGEYVPNIPRAAGERNSEYSEGQRLGNRLGNECPEQRSPADGERNPEYSYGPGQPEN